MPKNRVIPSGEKLIQLSKLTPSHWRTLFWLLDDDVDSNTGVDYFADGKKIVEPKFTDEQINEFIADRESSENISLVPDLQELVDDPSRVFELRAVLAQSDHAKSKAISREKKSVTDLSDRAQGGITSPLNQLRNLRGLGLLRNARLTLWDIAGDESKKPLEQFDVGSDAGGDESNERFSGSDHHYSEFWGTAKWFMRTTHGIANASSCFDHVADGGAIKAHAAYFDGKNLIDFIVARPRDLPAFFDRRFANRLGGLFLFERIKGKTYRKMILIYTEEELYDEKKLSKEFEDAINSVDNLGVRVEIGCGPVQAADRLSGFIKS